MLIANTLLDETDDSPVWVTCWGGPVTVTAALRYINDNFPEKKAYVANKLKIYMIAGKYQDTPDRVNISYITSHYDPIPMMIDNLVYEYTNGWGELKYWCDNVDYSTEEWVNANYNQNKGALANSFRWNNGWNDDVDGDAPSVLHILGSALGLRSTEDLTFGGWGSRFEANVNEYKAHINYFSDGGVDTWDGPNKLPDSNDDAWLQKRCYMGARWADDYQNELAVRADWCVKSYSEANHPPIVDLAISQDINAAPGQIIHLLCNPTDPDGDSISCNWWQYKEAGTSGVSVVIKDAITNNASFVCPDEIGKTIHIILEVQDNGKGYPLTRYARVIVNINNTGSDTEPPLSPQGVVSTESSAGITLNWDKNTETDLAGYNVRRSTTPGGPYATIASGISESGYSDSGLSPVATYYYVVTAVDTANNESLFSKELKATTLEFPQPKSYYDFEENDGTEVIDRGTADNTGILTGSQIVRSAVGGIVSSPSEGQRCVEITGSPYWGRSYFNVPYRNFHNSGNYTFSIWVKWAFRNEDTQELQSEWGYLFWQNGNDTEKTRHVDMWWNKGNSSMGVNLYDTDSADVYLQPEDPTGTELAVYDGNWHQVAISLENDTIVRMWTDGQLVKEVISAKPIMQTPDTNDLWIGCKPESVDEADNVTKMIGFIDRIRIYDMALTPEEMAQVFNSEAPAELPPSIPEGLTATGMRGEIDLDWNDNTETDLHQYNVMRSSVSGGPYEVISTVTTSEYTDVGLYPDTVFFYVVIAVNEKGYQSDTTAEVSATTNVMTEPRSFYDFEAGTGTTVADLGSAANNGVLVGSDITWVTGGIVSSDEETTGCIEMTGTTVYDGNSFVEVPYADFHNSDDYTFSAWVKWNVENNPDWAYLFWQDGDDDSNKTRHVDMWWYPGTHNALSSVVYDTTKTEVQVIPEDTGMDMYDGDWHFVALTLQGDTLLKLYEDGVKVGETITSVPIAKTSESHNLQIGAMPGLNMLGNIDRVRIYDEALGAGEMEYLYYSEHPDETSTSIKPVTDNTVFAMGQNSPNPFFTKTTIEYKLNISGKVSLQIFDLAGNIISTIEKGYQQPGTYKVKWNAAGLSEGIYFYRIIISSNDGVFSDTKKMVVTN
jgi:fibronectin type 3 domain-containing protein